MIASVNCIIVMVLTRECKHTERAEAAGHERVDRFLGADSDHVHNLHDEAEGAQDDKVVQSQLPFGHLCAPPERNPVEHPN